MTTHRPRDGRALPWTFLRRTIRPYAFAASLASAVVFVSMLTESGAGQSLDGLGGKIIGVAAGAVTLLLWLGWWRQNASLMEHGLLLSTGVWAAAASVILLEGASWTSGLIAATWMVASGGAWLLEVNDK